MVLVSACGVSPSYHSLPMPGGGTVGAFDASKFVMAIVKMGVPGVSASTGIIPASEAYAEYLAAVQNEAGKLAIENLMWRGLTATPVQS